MTTANRKFIDQHRSKLRNFKPKLGSKTLGLPVGTYFIITQTAHGFIVYNTYLRVPLIKINFEYIRDAYEFCESLIKHYGEFLCILTDEGYAEHIFQITQHTIKHGMTICNGIRSFEKLDKIRRPDLSFILDN